MNPNILEYVWIDGRNNLRSKIKVHYEYIPENVDVLNRIPIWNFDGSSTYQASTEESEVILKPVRVYRCPFRKFSAYIVLCTTHNNHRENAVEIFKRFEDREAWYGLEQEYFMYDNATKLPIGFDPNTPQGKYYCSVGADRSYGRKLANEHMEYCLYSGIKISGINQEVAPGQWEFQIGPSAGLKACDDLWISRYILEKLAEKYNICIYYHPKPLKGNWNGSGCHTNFSTKKMRDRNGLDDILQCMEKLSKKHLDHIAVYGEDNEMRLTGLHETSSMEKFTWSIGGRNCSVRIGNDTANNKMGYFEDRRPAANMDPYLVCPLILETCCEL